MSDRLDGTVALVTGASSGIGEATAVELAGQGAQVALVARRRDRLESLAERLGGDPLVIEADVTDEAAARSAVAQAVDRFGRLDTVIANAGVMLLGPIENAPVEEWQRMVSVNVLGLLYTSHAALPHLLAAASSEPRRVADLLLGRSGARGGAPHGRGALKPPPHRGGPRRRGLPPPGPPPGPPAAPPAPPA